MKKIIVANFKSNKTVEETVSWFQEFDNLITDTLDLELVIAPQVLALSVVKPSVKFSLAIQDLSSFPAGKYTGAVSVQNLKGLDIKYAILGHSERRKYFHETSHDVLLKVEQSISAGITPIICVDSSYLAEQLNLIASNLIEKCIIAYEPSQAIGSGANEDVGRVKEVVKKIHRLAGDIPVIYGGSVDEFNINEYLMVTDGVLVSTASLNVKQFVKVVQTVS